uniref:Ig-like domain-containing protein n=2 Tax=Parascaris univalens TaxID=6257 RepID=A0A915B3C2_PARUN
MCCGGIMPMRASWCTLLMTIACITVADDESCRTACYKDKIPMCGAWLVDDNSNDCTGTYQLNEGQVNLTCSMTSIPEPLQISWLYRAEFGSAWQPITCSSLNSAVSCRVNKVGEHRVTSNCLLKTDTLTLSGRYRCQAFERENNNDLVISSEAAINVVGIERFEVVHSSLRYGHPGHIEICANPKPEVVWLTRGAVLQPGHSTHRLSALQLMQLKSRNADRPQGPALPVPYCYRSHLVIGRVEGEDNYVSVIVRNEGETRNTPLKLHVVDLPSKAFMHKSAFTSYLAYFVLSALFALCFLTL